MARKKASVTDTTSDSEDYSQSSSEDEVQPTSAQPVRETAAPAKKRGRPPKDKSNAESTKTATEAGVKRGRGRPRKSDAVPTSGPEETLAPPKRGRGRPPKNAMPANMNKSTTSTDQPRRRGRPPKNPPATVEDTESEEEEEDQDETPPPKKRGRPPKATAKRGPGRPPKPKIDLSNDVEPEVKTTRPRGRPPKNPKANVNETGETSTKKRKVHDLSDHEDVPPPKRGGAGRPKKDAATKQGSSAVKKSVKVSDDNMSDANGRRYWLMKAEPESRLEKGVDVKYSIDDLKAAKEPDAWDGVRNAQARNNMAGMRKGELAFFYHSNCKTPGIAGIMEIVEESSPDETAFDPDHPYYDPKSSQDQPKWLCVHVAFKKKFKELVTLHTIKADAKNGGPLANMQLVNSSRLSVGKVSPAEWEYILSIAGESGDGDFAAAANGEDEDEEMADLNDGSPRVVILPRGQTNAAAPVREEESTEKLEEARAVQMSQAASSATLF